MGVSQGMTLMSMVHCVCQCCASQGEGLLLLRVSMKGQGKGLLLLRVSMKGQGKGLLLLRVSVKGHPYLGSTLKGDFPGNNTSLPTLKRIDHSVVYITTMTNLMFRDNTFSGIKAFSREF